MSELKIWSMKGKGLLGCELAEGWIHRWKPFKSKQEQKTENVVEETENKKIEIPQIR